MISDVLYPQTERPIDYKTVRKRHYKIFDKGCPTIFVKEVVVDGRQDGDGFAEKESESKADEPMKLRDGGGLAEEDMEMERRVGKKLKVKGGKLREVGDGLTDLLEGIPEEQHDDAEEEEMSVTPPTNAAASEVEAAADVKYVPPHLRPRAGKESEDRRAVRGLLNKLSESNVKSVTEEMIEMRSWLLDSVPRAGVKIMQPSRRANAYLQSLLQRQRSSSVFVAIAEMPP